MSSGRTPFIPLSNLTCGHLILLARRVTSVYLVHLDWPVHISTCGLQGSGFFSFSFALPGEVSFPAGGMGVGGVYCYTPPQGICHHP